MTGNSGVNSMDGYRFRILICIDGSDESYRGLLYTARLGRGLDCDIVLLYIRPADQGLRSGGLQVRVARENMLKWGLELPGIKYLKKGLDILKELEVMDGENWTETTTHLEIERDPLGDNSIEYVNADGRKIILKLKVAEDVARGILEQWELGEYDLIIMGDQLGDRSGGLAKSLWDPAVAEKVAIHATCSVLIARDLQQGRGHLLCVDGSDRALDMVRRDGQLALACSCPVSIISVALDDEGLPQAKGNVDAAIAALAEVGNSPVDVLTPVGDPVTQICEAGKNYSVIVVADTSVTGIKRFFMGGVSFKVLAEAENSVLISK